MSSDINSLSTDNSIFPGEVFANTADFDKGMRQLLPRYDEMLDVLVRCIANTNQRILELGCGTGELSLKLLRCYPYTQIIAVDYSPRMLRFAKAKIEAAGFADRWVGIELDFGEWANNYCDLSSYLKMTLDNKFNACVSSLAIHHLQDEMKSKLFYRIRESLISGGCFWNADPILAESAIAADIYQAVREDWAVQQLTTLTEIRARIGNSIPHGYSNPDRLATLSVHLEMLIKAGFDPVAVPWKYYGLAVFGGWVK
ncbi:MULTISPECIES: class I SAM-dependent methyltransferase [Kamptonema]|uniref:class I SAM-dependent methyltransferase n=1 Tax=Kamptonema TaxID=1501433 RepID=UPI0003160693|nr:MULTISPECIES: class I SAM-dependent methyltransferase [Kamptonema]